MNHESAAREKYWRSLDHLADTPEFKELVEREFPDHASEMTNPITRRNFLTLMGASVALAGLASCRRPVEKIIPYVIKPEEIIPGVAQYYATVVPFGLSAAGVMVKSHEGRPTKIEGHSGHPFSMGSANAFMQSAILGLYDPDRSAVVRNKETEKPWQEFVTAWQELYTQYLADKGKGLAVLSESFSSPTLFRLRAEFMKTFPEATWYTYEAVSDEFLLEGLRVATGAALRPVHHYEKAKVILSLESDFLYAESDSVVAARGFADGRRLTTEKDSMNRLYVAESSFSITGGMADHRLRLQPHQVGALAVAVAQALSTEGISVDLAAGIAIDNSDTLDKAWIQAVARDLASSRGASIVTAGRQQPPAVHAMVFAINAALGNVPATITYHEVTDAAVPAQTQLADLVASMNNANVTTLVMLGGNPAYYAPADLDFVSAMSNVRHTIHYSLYRDETSLLSTWHVPQAHFLESWGDARAADGTLSVIQPLIEPLWGAKTVVEFMGLINKGIDGSGYEAVRDTWKAYLKGIDFESQWRRVLHDGLLAGSATAPVIPKLNAKAARALVAGHPFSAEAGNADKLTISFRPSSSVFDGRFANNGWLQELPDSITKITWDNVALISPALARQLGIKQGLKDGQNVQPMIRLEVDGRTLDMPAWVQPGQADYTITVALGYGRTAAGRVGNKVGFNTYALRTSKGPYDAAVTVTKLDGHYVVASVQDHGGLDDDALASKEIERRVPTILREATLQAYRQKPDFASNDQVVPGFKDLKGEDGKPLSIYNAHVYDKGNQWGMSIDLNACIGCNACTVACQSENNIPVVGKSQVLKGREMHWIRMDRYYRGTPDNPQVSYQPVACVHCETAPCEQVCPVAATVHDSEGLNVMVYNRCVGTRYCANNCPFKVRRFNFLEYNPGTSGFLQVDGAEVLKMSKNPDVTVRMRGVMEKCTYCVQRISGARQAAKKENRDIRDGEVVTACQQTCPTQAIVFGNINDPESRVVKVKQQNRQYDLLAELNIRPRTSYMAKLRNPNPALSASETPNG